MKALYTLFLASIIIAPLDTYSQVQFSRIASSAIPTVLEAEKEKKPVHNSKSEIDEIIYWTEDFSNGLNGQGNNGAWTTGGEQGNLWFKTFPVGNENGYNPELPLFGGTHPDYGIKLPIYFGNTNHDVCSSPTRDNGVMMLDADRWNSTLSDENPEGDLTQFALETSLTSPLIDLTGAENILLVYNQNIRLCCTGYSATLDLSVDSGSTWHAYDIFGAGPPNTQLDQQIAINVSDVVQNADDLSKCLVRFNWDGIQSHYFWTVDDIFFTSIPDNDIVAGETFTNTYFLQENTVFAEENPTPAAEYYSTFEYTNQPNYYARPFNFAMQVSNVGVQTQTDVTLQVIWTAPSGISDTLYSVPIELAAGVTDTLIIPNITYESLNAETGQYLFDFSVSQNEADAFPIDNIGASRYSLFSQESVVEPFAIMQNFDDSLPNNLTFNPIGQDLIWSTAYSFPEPAQGEPIRAITHIETVFMFAANFAETVVGTTIYFNLRKGHPLEDDPNNPSGLSQVLFGNDNLTYTDAELEYEIQESDLWHFNSGEPYVWTSFELPTWVLIEPGVIYNAEYRIPQNNAIGVVFPPIGTGSEKYASLIYTYDNSGWSGIGNISTNLVIPLRLRTGTPLNTEKISLDKGLSLVQNYPNPFSTSTKIQFRTEETRSLTLQIHDITGKLVLEKNLGIVPAKAPQTYEFQKGNLSPGIYSYSIGNSDFRISRKLTVQ